MKATGLKLLTCAAVAIATLSSPIAALPLEPADSVSTNIFRASMHPQSLAAANVQGPVCVYVKTDKASIIAIVDDKCADCGNGHLQLAPEAYKIVADEASERTDIQWMFVDCKDHPLGIITEPIEPSTVPAPDDLFTVQKKPCNTSGDNHEAHFPAPLLPNVTGPSGAIETQAPVPVVPCDHNPIPMLEPGLPPFNGVSSDEFTFPPMPPAGAPVVIDKDCEEEMANVNAPMPFPPVVPAVAGDNILADPTVACPPVITVTVTVTAVPFATDMPMPPFPRGYGAWSEGIPPKAPLAGYGAWNSPGQIPFPPPPRPGYGTWGAGPMPPPPHMPLEDISQEQIAGPQRPFMPYPSHQNFDQRVAEDNMNGQPPFSPHPFAPFPFPPHPEGPCEESAPIGDSPVVLPGAPIVDPAVPCEEHLGSYPPGMPTHGEPCPEEHHQPELPNLEETFLAPEIPELPTPIAPIAPMEPIVSISPISPSEHKVSTEQAEAPPAYGGYGTW